MVGGVEKIDISVIIPVYNQETQLQEGIRALLQEQGPSGKIEILLINDGSTDGSGELCRSLSDRYPQIRYFEQENRGVSAARNQGIRNAKGKYLFYMDADDRLEPETLRVVKEFFDTVEQEVDLVTYRIDTVSEGKILKSHFRYQYLQASGVYDLKKYAYIGQTTMNIAVRNQFEHNILFDESQTFSEDQKYCCQVLRNKLRMGYCAEGRYIYHRRESSASGRLAGSCYIFEQCTALFEEVFSWYDSEVPVAFQGLYINDFYWKLCCNILFPHHYIGEVYEKAVERLVKLLNRCDSKVILQHPNIDFFEKYYMLRLKGPDIMEWRICGDGFGLFYQNECTVWESSVEIVMTKCFVREDRVVIEGFLKSVFFQFYEQIPILCAVENNNRRIKKITLRPSTHNYYLSHEKTQKFWAFTYECEARLVQQVRFEMGIGGKWFPVHYYFMPCVPFSHNYQRYEYFSHGLRLFLDESETLHVSKVSDRRNKAVWLYYDCAGVVCDNGMLQFCHDYGQKDGVKRYYVVSDVRQWERLPNRICGVLWGSQKHRRLFRQCEKIITAYIEESNVIPYSREEYEKYAGNFKWEIVYLQHGVLHIDMPWKYSPERMLANQVVVSTKQEAALYEKNGFCSSDLIKCRMPRLTDKQQHKGKGKKVLYAPSWRSYLVGKYGCNHQWERMDEKFEASNYYQKMYDLLKAEMLQQLLEKYDMEIDLKLHPIFEIYRKYFDDLPKRIHVIGETGPIEEYVLFITDFSSYLYDYLFAGVPVFIYLPDEKEFRCGMNGYRDMGEEDYWENVNTEPNALLRQIKLYLEQGIYEGIKTDFYEGDKPMEEIYQREITLSRIKYEGDMKMISVIIPYSEDQTYLKRCLSMIKRQSCDDLEIILITDDCPSEIAEEYSLNVIYCVSAEEEYSRLNQAIDMAKGEYIYFLRMTSVCAENTLEVLWKAVDNDRETFYCIPCYCEQKNKFRNKYNELMYPYGKLFNKEIIKSHNIRFNENSLFSEIEFLVAYMQLYHSVQLMDNLEIYETGIPVVNMEGAEVDAQEWKSLLSQVRLLEESVKNLVVEWLCQIIKKYQIVSDELIFITEEELHEAYEINYEMAKPVLKKWWTEIKNNQNEEVFEKLKAYLELFEQEEDFLSLLMYTCGLTKEQYCYLKNNNLKKALYFLGETSEKKSPQIYLEKKLLPLKKEIEDLRTSIEEIKVNKNTVEELEGVKLAEFSVNKYSNGKLGLQTILKSFQAWIKYKFKR